jgi:hypothetical protein
VGQPRKHLRQVIQPVQVDADDHNGRPEQHCTDPLISALADFGHIPADSEALLLSKFEKVFTHFHNSYKDYGSNRLFQTDAAYTAYRGRRMHSNSDNLPSLALTQSARVRPLRSPQSNRRRALQLLITYILTSVATASTAAAFGVTADINLRVPVVAKGKQ